MKYTTKHVNTKSKAQSKHCLAFKNSETHRQAITLHCITPSLEIT